jgi:hypothetical protein
MCEDRISELIYEFVLADHFAAYQHRRFPSGVSLLFWRYNATADLPDPCHSQSPI